MSTPATPPDPAAAQAAADAAAQQAAARGATREEVREEIAAALAAQQDKRGSVQLSDEQVDTISERMITKLDERGAFEDDPPQGTPDPHQLPTPPPAGAAPPNTTPDPNAVVAGAPRKRTFAERFVGRE